MVYGSYRKAWAEISLDAIEENVKAFQKELHPNTRLMAVVKADGYGHGAVEVAKAAIQAGADRLAVALLDEAILLRKSGVKAPILILGYTPPDAVEEAISENITITVYSKNVIHRMIQVAEAKKKIAKIHLKVDTGMGRIGVRTKEEALELAKSISSDFVKLEGIFTHFADADNPKDSSYTYQQYEKFTEILNYLKKSKIHIPIKHCCNTAATISFPQMHLDMVRVGIGIYGVYPQEHFKNQISLKPSMSFKTKPTLIKKVPSSQTISYGRTYFSNQEALIATIPIGYADGLCRQLSNRGQVTIRGKKVPIVGRICMDQSMIDVTGMENLSLDEVVTIFGDAHQGNISVEEVAQKLDTISYEVLCLIGRRVPRVYLKNRRQIGVKSLINKL